MARFTKAQIAQRRRTAALILGAIALLVIGGCTINLTKALVGVPEQRDVHVADPKAMNIPATETNAAAHAQLLKGTSLKEGESIGIDVSGHQGSIAWAKVKADGYSFAYIKATEGKGYTDPQFEKNWKGAQKAGVTVGAYHYFTLCSPGADQARDFLKAAPVNDAHLPPALDLEFDGACEERPQAAHAQKEVEDFLRIVESAWGRRMVIYSSGAWRSHYGLPQSEGRPDWIFSDKARPKDPEWAVWQLHFKGKVNGISTPVDIDVVREEKLRTHSQLNAEARKALKEAARQESEDE